MNLKLKTRLKTLGLILVIATIATGIDWVVHSSRESFYVPEEYYRNKIIFATLFGVIAVYIFGKMNIKSQNIKAILFSSIISVLLQVKYFLQGFDMFFLILFLFLHCFMLLLPALYFFKKYPKYF